MGLGWWRKIAGMLLFLANWWGRGKHWCLFLAIILFFVAHKVLFYNAKIKILRRAQKKSALSFSKSSQAALYSSSKKCRSSLLQNEVRIILPIYCIGFGPVQSLIKVRFRKKYMRTCSRTMCLTLVTSCSLYFNWSSLAKKCLIHFHKNDCMVGIT